MAWDAQVAGSSGTDHGNGRSRPKIDPLGSGTASELRAQRIWRSAGVRTARRPVALGFEDTNFVTGFGYVCPID